MGPSQRPLHLLLLDESSADYLVDRRLHECRADRFPLTPMLAEVRDELAVIADVCFKLTEAVGNLLCGVRTDLNENPTPLTCRPAARGLPRCSRATVDASRSPSAWIPQRRSVAAPPARPLSAA